MDLTSLQCIALQAATSDSLPPVLDCMVDGLSQEPGVILARVWLRGPGDLCDECPLRSECPKRDECLHLVASAGHSTANPTETWSNTTGRFQRFPIGARKVGRIGLRGEGLLLSKGDGEWAVDQDWIDREGVECFAGQPLVFRGEVFGVVAIFSQRVMTDEEFGWLRTFADQAAVAIANARALQELDMLRKQLELERDYLREELQETQHFSGIVGDSPAIAHLLNQIQMVAPSDATVLITGESGTGKELIATAIHEQSTRRKKPLVRVNCAATPTELFESEFFGHVRGSFTGASHDRAGRFQVADGGTLFLDEVGEIPVFLQGKLLRVLQEGQFSRVGEDQLRTVDVRLIAATNKDLEKEVAEGRFREDLYYRLAVFPLEVPPLRERPDDIPLLAKHFVEHARSKRGAALHVSTGELERLRLYDWPGNVRELQNVIQRGLITQVNGVVTFALPTTDNKVDTDPKASNSRVFTDAEMKLREKENILAALAAAGGRVSGTNGAAELLGIRPTTLTSRMKKLGVERGS